MTDQTKLTEHDEEELIPVETPIEDNADDQADEEQHEDGDERVAESDDDLDEDTTSEDTEGENSARKRRLKRRQHQRAARERTEAELRMLREQNAEMQRRLAAVEGHASQTNAQAIEQELQRALNDARMAEQIIAKAIEAGNGEDVAAAMRIRDQAQADAARFAQAKEQLTQASRQTTLPQASFAQQWHAANQWFNPQGVDADSVAAKRIDADMLREGWDPNTREYWVELTTRCKEHFEGGDVTASKNPPKRKAPPTGQTREHAPQSTRKEIYVTPERKQAMIEAGAWDDPVKRQKMLRRYREYDQTSAR